LIESEKQELIWASMQEDLRMYTAKVFERFCMEWLKKNNGSDIFHIIIAEIGSWWGKDPRVHAPNTIEHEIDILAFGKNDKEILVGECKWQKKYVGVDVLVLLLERASFFSKTKQELFIFAKSGFTEECIAKADEYGVRLVTFDEMFMSE